MTPSHPSTARASDHRSRTSPSARSKGTPARRSATLLALICLPPLWLTVRFFSHVEAGLQEMLPRDTPTVRALDRIHDRLGSQAHLKIIVQSADPAANRRFVTALAGRLEGRRIPEVR